MKFSNLLLTVFFLFCLAAVTLYKHLNLLLAIGWAVFCYSHIHSGNVMLAALTAFACGVDLTIYLLRDLKNENDF